MMINENCPCKKKKCERHGRCDECRKYHAESKRQRPVACEKGKKGHSSEGLITTDKIQKRDREKIFQGLLQYNLAKLEDTCPKDLGVYYEKDGDILAGLIGETHGNWLTVKYLWVSEALRGQHIGTEILEQAEKTARERGCRYCFLGKRHYFTKEL